MAPVVTPIDTEPLLSGTTQTGITSVYSGDDTIIHRITNQDTSIEYPDIEIHYTQESEPVKVAITAIPSVTLKKQFHVEMKALDAHIYIDSDIFDIHVVGQSPIQAMEAFHDFFISDLEHYSEISDQQRKRVPAADHAVMIEAEPSRY